MHGLFSFQVNAVSQLPEVPPLTAPPQMAAPPMAAPPMAAASMAPLTPPTNVSPAPIPAACEGACDGGHSVDVPAAAPVEEELPQIPIYTPQAAPEQPPVPTFTPMTAPPMFAPPQPPVFTSGLPPLPNMPQVIFLLNGCFTHDVQILDICLFKFWNFL